ncbi:unnamed protein product [Allacma fusca]|uniref:Uncharacterized protein n=1 Tax=Allacma fusca TaxID=39272 RepID=A0A8J2KL10_9HEXA|nr:unnamed protein product [Allacma fusca]
MVSKTIFTIFVIALAIISVSARRHPYYDQDGPHLPGYARASSRNDATSGMHPDGSVFANANAAAKAQVLNLNRGVNFALADSRAGASAVQDLQKKYNSWNPAKKLRQLKLLWFLVKKILLQGNVS